MPSPSLMSGCFVPGVSPHAVTSMAMPLSGAFANDATFAPRQPTSSCTEKTAMMVCFVAPTVCRKRISSAHAARSSIAGLATRFAPSWKQSFAYTHTSPICTIVSASALSCAPMSTNKSFIAVSLLTSDTTTPCTPFGNDTCRVRLMVGLMPPTFVTRRKPSFSMPVTM